MIAHLVLVPVLLLAALPAFASPVLPFTEALPWGRLATAHTGDWAEYVVRVGEHPVGPWLRFLVVGGADGGGSWLEIWISQRPGSATQAFRVLIDGQGRTRRVIDRLVGGASRELPAPESASEGPPEHHAPSFLNIGEEAVQTNAGVLRAARLEAREGSRLLARSWLAPEVPVFGLVRLDLANGTGLELYRWGSGGKGVVAFPDTGSLPARAAVPPG